MLNIAAENPALFVLFAAAFLISIALHEFSHAFAATVQGDPTAKEHGRLTLNPIAHIDPFGFLLVLIAGIGWAKPVPFNPLYLRNRRYGAAIVSLAGPLANLFQIVVFGLLLKGLAPLLGSGNFLVIFLIFLVELNIILLLFNLVPIPPLDGSRVLFSLLPRRSLGIQYALERYGIFLLFGIVLLDQFIARSLGQVGLFAMLFRVASDLVFRFLT